MRIISSLADPPLLLPCWDAFVCSVRRLVKFLYHCEVGPIFSLGRASQVVKFDSFSWQHLVSSADVVGGSMRAVVFSEGY